MSRPNVDVADLDRRFLWHPFTQMRDWMSASRWSSSRPRATT